jgi:hypothetical protein
LAGSAVRVEADDSHQPCGHVRVAERRRDCLEDGIIRGKVRAEAEKGMAAVLEATRSLLEGK